MPFSGTGGGGNGGSGAAAFADLTGAPGDNAALAAALAALAIPTGTVWDYFGSTPPAGWLFCDGRGIGSALSGGPARANADTEALFTLLWNSLSNDEAPVFGGPRGASAAIDFAANRYIALPDCRGRVLAGRDDMGGSPASRLTLPVSGDVLGAAGGAETHELAEGELPEHDHSYNEAAASGTTVSNQSSDVGVVESLGGGTQSTGPAGSGGAHNNVQPTLVANKIIKL